MCFFGLCKKLWMNFIIGVLLYVCFRIFGLLKLRICVLGNVRRMGELVVMMN